jgi:hypothetical protein
MMTADIPWFNRSKTHNREHAQHQRVTVPKEQRNPTQQTVRSKSRLESVKTMAEWELVALRALPQQWKTHLLILWILSLWPIFRLGAFENPTKTPHSAPPLRPANTSRFPQRAARHTQETCRIQGEVQALGGGVPASSMLCSVRTASLQRRCVC